jgi:hypothetical protein
VPAAGYFQLRRALDDAQVAHYRVEESTAPDFRVAWSPQWTAGS